MRTIYIHIGLHKTGTTTIQNYLLQNIEPLSDEGVLVPFKHRNHNLTYWVNGKKHGKRRDHQWKRFQRKLDQSAHPIVAVSSEFFSRDISEIETWYDQFDVLLKQGFKLSFILYLRRPDRRFESLFIEAVKGGAAYGSIEDFPYDRFIDVWQLSEAITQRYGKEALIIRKFEEDVRKGLISSFLDCMGLGHIEVDEDAYQANAKPMLDQLRAIRYAGELFADLLRPMFRSERKKRKAIKRWGAWLVEATEHWNDTRKYSLLPQRIAHKILEDQKEISEKIAASYFNGDISHLYTDELGNAEVSTLRLEEMQSDHLMEMLRLLPKTEIILEAIHDDEPNQEDSPQND